MIMKKIISLLLVAALTIPVWAQEEEAPIQEQPKPAKDYSEYLPQEGDLSLGFSLNPVATFVGNIFNAWGTTGVQNTLDPLAGEPLAKPAGLPDMASIMGTYMLTDNWGIRFNVGLGVSWLNNRAYVRDDAARFINPFSTLEGLDKVNALNLGASASVGAEYRVGKRRVQGVFGFGLTYGCWALTRTNYTYYNAITEGNQNPSNAGLYGGAVNPKFATDYSFIDNPRLLSRYTNGGTHILGAYGSVGVECFVAPKIALGLNVNLLINYQWEPARVQVWEGWNRLTQQREEIVIHNRALNDGFRFSTDNIGANLYIAFYFGTNK